MMTTLNGFVALRMRLEEKFILEKMILGMLSIFQITKDYQNDLHENDSVFKNYIDIYIKPCKHNTAYRRITIYQNKEQIISFDEYITDKNIYRGINDTFFLNYSFVEKKLSNNHLTDNYSPFINSHILDFEKKSYYRFIILIYTMMNHSFVFKN